MLSEKYIISLDIGTTHTKVMLGKLNGEIADIVIKDYATLYPGPGKVEQDPNEVLNAVVQCIKLIIEKNDIKSDNILALVFGGILHSFLPIDKQGNKLSNAIIWADTRSMKESDYLRTTLDVEDIRYRTGCSIHPLYYLPKLLWLKNNAYSIFRETWKFISIKEYIIFKLFGSLLVDRSIASGTGIWNMRTLTWDQDLLSIAGLSAEYFSPVVDTTTIIKGLKREYSEVIGLKDTIAVIGSSDGPLAHLGSVGTTDKNISLTVGTGAAIRILVNHPTILPNKEAWCYYLAENKWLLGGVVHDAGIAMKWLIDNTIGTGITKNPFSYIDKIVGQIEPGSDGLLFLPYLGGERSPNYNPSIRGAIYGLSYNHTNAHIARSLMEGMAYRLYSVYKMVTSDKKKGIVITGGILKSPNWLQITADFFGKNFLIPQIKEASAFGGVLLGLKALNIIDDFNKINNFINYQKELKYKQTNHNKYIHIIEKYKKLYFNLYP